MSMYQPSYVDHDKTATPVPFKVLDEWWILNVPEAPPWRQGVSSAGCCGPGKSRNASHAAESRRQSKPKDVQRLGIWGWSLGQFDQNDHMACQDYRLVLEMSSVIYGFAQNGTLTCQLKIIVMSKMRFQTLRKVLCYIICPDQTRW